MASKRREDRKALADLRTQRSTISEERYKQLMSFNEQLNQKGSSIKLYHVTAYGQKELNDLYANSTDEERIILNAWYSYEKHVFEQEQQITTKIENITNKYQLLDETDYRKIYRKILAVILAVLAIIFVFLDIGSTSFGIVLEWFIVAAGIIAAVAVFSPYDFWEDLLLATKPIIKNIVIVTGIVAVVAAYQAILTFGYEKGYNDGIVEIADSLDDAYYAGISYATNSYDAMAGDFNIFGNLSDARSVIEDYAIDAFDNWRHDWINENDLNEIMENNY